MVSFPIVADADNAALVAWTTTPWTLPSNLALCVNANLTYAKVGTFHFLHAVCIFCSMSTAHPGCFVTRDLLFMHFSACNVV